MRERKRLGQTVRDIQLEMRLGRQKGSTLCNPRQPQVLNANIRVMSFSSMLSSVFDLFSSFLLHHFSPFSFKFIFMSCLFSMCSNALPGVFLSLAWPGLVWSCLGYVLSLLYFFVF